MKQFGLSTKQVLENISHNLGWDIKLTDFSGVFEGEMFCGELSCPLSLTVEEILKNRIIELKKKRKKNTVGVFDGGVSYERDVLWKGEIKGLKRLLVSLK